MTLFMPKRDHERIIIIAEDCINFHRLLVHQKLVPWEKEREIIVWSDNGLTSKYKISVHYTKCSEISSDKKLLCANILAHKRLKSKIYHTLLNAFNLLNGEGRYEWLLCSCTCHSAYFNIWLKIEALKPQKHSNKEFHK